MKVKYTHRWSQPWSPSKQRSGIFLSLSPGCQMYLIDFIQPVCSSFTFPSRRSFSFLPHFVPPCRKLCGRGFSKQNILGRVYLNDDGFQPPHLSTHDQLYALIEGVRTFHKSHVDLVVRWFLRPDLHQFLRKIDKWGPMCLNL